MVPGGLRQSAQLRGANAPRGQPWASGSDRAASRARSVGGCSARVGASLLLGSLALLSACGEHSADPSAGPASIKADITWGELGISPGQFSKPRGIAMDPGGDGKSVWVIDMSARVQRLDAATGRCTYEFRMPEFEMGRPTGVTIARHADTPGGEIKPRLYVADTHYHRIRVYDISNLPETEKGVEPPLLASFGSFGEEPGQFIFVTDVAVLTSPEGMVERIYTTEYGGNDRICVFDADHKFLFSFGQFGDGSHADKIEFNRPQSIAIINRSTLVVTDACNHRLGVFTLDGKVLRWIGGPEFVTSENGFNYPYGIADMGDGTVLLAEWGGNRVTRVDPTGAMILGRWGKAGRGAGEIATPWGVEFHDGSAFVLDTGNARVMRFEVPRASRGLPVGNAGDDGGVSGGGVGDRSARTMLGGGA
jgi:DNA-binding beta-propeller fold protein YncE